MDQKPENKRLLGYKWIDEPEQGFFLERLNRFACLVELNGEATKVYLPNSGRLQELLRPGAQVVVERRRGHGKTHHDLLLIQTPQFPSGEATWAALDSRLPPALFRWLVENKRADSLAGAVVQATEPTVSHGRLDLLLSVKERPVYVETKSVNLIDAAGIARFPDAPTARGQRHLEALTEIKQSGLGATLAFIVVRGDAVGMAPFSERDPKFTQALQRASNANVRIQAHCFEAGPTMLYRGSLSVNTDPEAFPGYWPPLPPSGVASHGDE
ncbi:MAG: DNA/RNA nuclease SfsA [Anaerolineales bacterium]